MQLSNPGRLQTKISGQHPLGRGFDTQSAATHRSLSNDEGAPKQPGSWSEGKIAFASGHRSMRSDRLAASIAGSVPTTAKGNASSAVADDARSAP